MEFVISIHTTSTFSLEFSEYVPYKDTKSWGWLGCTSLLPDAPQPSAVETPFLGFPGRQKPRENSSCSTGIPSTSTKAPRCPEHRATKHMQVGYTVHVQQDQRIQALPAYCQHLSQHVRMNMNNSCFLDIVTCKHSKITPGSRMSPSSVLFPSGRSKTC